MVKDKIEKEYNYKKAKNKLELTSKKLVNQVIKLE